MFQKGSFAKKSLKTAGLDIYGNIANLKFSDKSLKMPADAFAMNSE